MRIAVAVVMSLDGKLTRGDEPDIHQWTSDEDQTTFRSLLAEYDCIVMGRGTYTAIQQNIARDDERLRIVLTSEPEKFKSEVVAGKLEFRNQRPTALVKDLETAGKNSLLIVGGPQMIEDFLQDNLIEKLYITVEPLLFGKGHALLPGTELINQQLQLVSHRQLNDRGTLLLEYIVV